MMNRREMIAQTGAMAALVAVGTVAATSPALAASNPQRISRGFPFPVYINGTGTSKSMAQFVYVNQTQYTPATNTSAQRLPLLGVGN